MTGAIDGNTLGDMSGSPEAMFREALLLDKQGSVLEAMAAYSSVLQRAPRLANAWYNLAVLQRKTRQFAAALASYQQALDHGIRAPEEVHLNRGVIFADDLRQYPQAERELRAALDLNPNYIPALINFANLHEDLGRRDAAGEVYERILALDANQYEVLSRYANLRKFSSQHDPLIARMRNALADPHATAADRASLGFALGRALDACGAFDAAFTAYSQANRASRASAGATAVPYDRAAFERFVDRLIAIFAAPNPVAVPACMRQEQGPLPIFICGMFRSGSTLTEQILARHPRVFGGGELDFLPHAVRVALAPFPESILGMAPAKLATLRAEYLKMLATLAPDAEFLTDKRPDNFLYLGLIKQLFPAAKIVHTTRHAVDNCLSIFFLHLDHSMSYALDLADIGHYYVQYRRLMSHWQRLYADDIVEFPYDSFVAHPKAQAQRLIQQIGLEWDESCLDLSASPNPVKTASVWQVREPLYRSSSGRSAHYAAHVSELREYLAKFH